MSSVFDEGELIDPTYEFFHYNQTSSVNWMTKEGKLMKISEMTDSHLANAIKKMLREKGTPYFLLEEYFKRSQK